MPGRVRDGLIGGAGCLLGLAVLVLLPDQVPGATLAAIGDMRSPAFFPALAAVLVLVAGAAILLASGRADAQPAEDRPLLPWATMVAAIAGAASIPLVGIHAGLAVTILSVGLVLGARPVPLVLIGAGTIAGVHLLFVRVLKVVFPDPALPLPAWWPL